MRDSIVFYKSFYEAIKELPQETQIELYTAIFERYFYNKTTQLSKMSKAILTLITPAIDSANLRYFASVENGKKGGAPKNNQNAKKQPKNNLELTKKQPRHNLETSKNNLYEDVDGDVDVYVDVDDNDNVNVDVDGNEDDMSISIPSAPLIIFDDVFAYGLRQGAGKEYCKKFFDYYESKNWQNANGEFISDWQNVFDKWWEKDKGDKVVDGNRVITPSWLGKEIVERVATKEEEDEIKKLLSEFK